MPTPIIMPKLGLTMETGRILSWLKKEGDTVEKGEIIVEIETDKLTNDVESPETGTLLKILVPDDTDDVKVQTPIGIIGETGEDISQFLTGNMAEQHAIPSPQNQQQFNAENSEPGLPDRSVNVRISPRARKMIAEKGIDPAVFQTLGKRRITADDVNAYLEKQGDTIAKSPRIPIQGMRKIIAQRLTESKRTIPHAYFRTTVDASKMIALRNAISTKDERPAFHDILIKVVAAVLAEFPQVNVALIENTIVSHAQINIGLAVSLTDGLIVPVVKDANRKPLDQLRQVTRELIQKARNNTLTPDDISGGTFTITNLGMYQIDEFTPIINPPESAILGIGRIAERVWAEHGKIGIRPEIILTLCVDHRVIDGALAAQFLERVKQRLETLEVLSSVKNVAMTCESEIEHG